jgi:hypothetical protein
MPHHIRCIPLRLFSAAALISLVFAAVFGAGLSRADILPQIVVIPDLGAPGDTVEVLGSGFPPGVTLGIFFSQVDTKLVGTAGADEAGNFTTMVVVPEDAEVGTALFVAENTLVRAEADFFVDASEPIDDKRGPPADKVPLCEVVITLDKVVNRLDSSDETFKISTTANGSVGEDVEVVAKNGEVTRVAKNVARYKLPKASFPKGIVFTTAVKVVREGQKKPFLAALEGNVDILKRSDPTDREWLSKVTVDCPGRALFEFTEENGTSIELRDKFKARLGFMDFFYLIRVNEVQAQ